MDSAEGQMLTCAYPIEYLAKLLFVDTKWRGSATHAHGPAFGITARVHPHGHAGTNPQAGGDGLDSFGLKQRFQVNFTNTFRDHALQFGFGFAGTSEEDSVGLTATAESLKKFAGGSDLEAGTLAQKIAQNSLVRIRFYGVADGEFGRQSSPKKIPLIFENAGIVGEERCAVCFGKDGGAGPTDEKFSAFDLKKVIRQPSSMIH